MTQSKTGYFCLKKSTNELILWLGIFLSFALLHGNPLEDDSLFDNIANLEGTPSAVVGDAVNAITG